MINKTIVIVGLIGSLASIASYLDINPSDQSPPYFILGPVVIAAAISLVVCLNSLWKHYFSVRNDFLVNSPEKTTAKWSGATLIVCLLLAYLLSVNIDLNSRPSSAETTNNAPQAVTD